MDKITLRALYKAKRNDLTLEEREDMNSEILHHLQQIDWSSPAYVHVYLSITKNNEFETLPFITWLTKNHPSVKIVVSKSSLEAPTMKHFLLDSDTILLPNKWGIPEPVAGHQVDEKLLDIIIIPLLIADQTGGRVGYGKGFYDRFLATCRPDIQTIGISYFEPIDTIDDLGPWDYPLNKLITPKNMHVFK